MNDKLLSIIVPVYNIQDYIVRCLDSVMEQDLPAEQYEVIAVDDGSKDQSAAIIHQYMGKYPNLRYVYQENQGLSGARNTGIEHAQGEYIWFVDGDDMIRKNCLQELSKLIKTTQVDIFTFDFFYSKEQNDLLKHTDTVMSGLDFLYHYRSTISACRHWYRREFLQSNKLKFTLRLLHEDGEFNLRAFSLAQQVIYHSEPYYIYDTSRGGSITHGVLAPRQDAMIRVVVLICDFLKTQKIPSKYNSTFSCILLKNCLLPAFRMTGHPKVSTHQIRDNYGLIRKIAWDAPGYYRWKLAVLLPPQVLCSLLKITYRIYKLLKKQ